MQLRELALLNGTLRENDGPRCSNCGAADHKSWMVSIIDYYNSIEFDRTVIEIMDYCLSTIQPIITFKLNIITMNPFIDNALLYRICFNS